MQFCTAAFCILLLLFITEGSGSGSTRVTVKLHDSAVLPCLHTCTGMVRWTLFTIAGEVLAECDRSSCRSMKEGFEMIHDQYLQGNLSLMISEADFSKRALYIGQCNAAEVCAVALKIEPLKTVLKIKPGESVLLKIDVPEPLEVVYNGTGSAGSKVQICTLVKGSVQCNSDYSQRASVLSAVELRGMKESESGVYTVRDTYNDEDIHSFPVTITDGGDGSEAQSQKNTHSRVHSRSVITYCTVCDCAGCAGAGFPVWVILLGAVLVILLGVAAMLIGWLYKENQKLQAESGNNRDQYMLNGDQRNEH